MAYADQQMSSNRIVAIIIVALLHVLIGYTLVTGLAYEAAKSVVERVTTIDVEEPEEPEPEEEPPPPPEEVPDTAPPPVVVPPAPIQLPNPNRLRDTSRDPVERPPQPVQRATTKTCADGRTVDASASCGPQMKSCPGGQSVPVNANCPSFTPPKDPTPRGNAGRWVTTNDYPSRSLREEEEGVTTVTLTVGADGRVDNCRVTGSSGHERLDEATCKNMQRRARFNPATDSNGNEVSGTYTQSVRWQIPQ